MNNKKNRKAIFGRFISRLQKINLCIEKLHFRLNFGFKCGFGGIVATLIFILAIGSNSTYLIANPDSTPEPYKILFIGSSYFNFNNLPDLFKNIANISEKEVYIDQLIPSGLYLEDHANSSSTELKINEKNWDYVILQGVGRITAYPNIYTDHPVKTSLITLHNKISANYEFTKMVFCLPWAYEDGMTWLDGWTDTYEDMQIKIYENTLKYADDVGFVIAPVGWAWNTVLKEKNHPLHYLHLSDWNHPSLRGSYLMACVIFSTIFQESSIDIPFYSDLPLEDANYFQTVGSNTVLENLDLWKINAIDMGITDFSIPPKYFLHPNYPNPFNSFTSIFYEISEQSKITIKIYDLMGNLVNTIVSERQPVGQYQVNWNGTDKTGKYVSGGIYFYQFQAGDYTKTKKMLLLK